MKGSGGAGSVLATARRRGEPRGTPEDTQDEKGVILEEKKYFSCFFMFFSCFLTFFRMFFCKNHHFRVDFLYVFGQPQTIGLY